MPETPLHLRIFVSSPGDVGDERRIAREVIERLPREPLLEGKLAMDAVMWDAPDAPVPLAATETPQASVNRYKGLAADCDLTVIVLWSRIGTPLSGQMRRPDGSTYVSGTEFEYESAAAYGREVWIYHRTEPVTPSDERGRSQLAAVRTFLDRVRGAGAGGVNEYASAAAFGPHFKKHLEAFVRRRLDGDVPDDGPPAPGGPPGAPHWLWEVPVGRAAARSAEGCVTVRGPAGTLVVGGESWPEFADVRHTYRWFVGRDEMFARIAAFLDRRPSGYFRVVGGAGLGKTALAVEIARRYRAPAYFVSAPAGRTAAEHVLGALCAQVIVRYGLPHRQLPAGAGESGDALYALLEEAAARAENRPVVVVVDGLDEAEPPPRGHNWLRLPKALPAGAYAVLLHRPGELPLVVEPGVPLESADMEDDSRAQRRDVEAYLRHEVARPDVSAALQRLRPPVAAADFVTRLADASEGNFMYLSYMLAEVADASIGPQLESALPRGLDGYYRSVWERMSEGKTSDRGTWKGVQRPVLALLAAAREPVTVEWLASHSGVDPDDVRELALAPWSRFLSRSARAPRWRVLHKSFSDFLAARSEIDLPRTHAGIAEYYRSEIGRADQHGGYAYRHLSAHLVEAGRFDALAALVENAEWYRAQRRHDPSGRGYGLDVLRGLTAARALGPRGLGSTAAWSLLYGTLATIASDVPLDVLDTLVMLGREELALAHAALITDPERRVEAHVRAATALLERDEDAAAAAAAIAAWETLPQVWPGNRPAWVGPIAELLERAGRGDVVAAGSPAAADGGAGEEPEARPAANATDAPEDAVPDEAQADGDAEGGDDTGGEDHLAAARLADRIAAAGERIADGADSRRAIEDAFDGTSVIVDDLERHVYSAVAGLVEQLADAGNTEGVESLEQTVRAREGLTTTGLLGMLAAWFSAMEQPVRARALLAEADRRLLTSPREGWDASRIVGELIVRHAQVEGSVGLASLLDEARDDLEGYHLSWTLTALTQVLAAGHDLEGVRTLLARVDDVTEEYRGSLLGALAAAFLDADLDAEADVLMLRAEAISEREWRLSAVSSVARALAQAGRHAAAAAAVDRIIAATGSTPFSAGEVRALCELAEALESANMHDAALTALARAEQAADPRWRFVGPELAVTVGRVRDAGQAHAMLDAALEACIGAEPELAHEAGETLGALAFAMGAAGYADGLARVREALRSVPYPHGRARVLTHLGAAWAKLHRLDEATRAFDDALHVAGPHGTSDSEAAQSEWASALSDWFGEVRARCREIPALRAELWRLGVIGRAVAAARNVCGKDWGPRVLGDAACALLHTDDRAAAEQLLATLERKHPDEAARVHAEQAMTAAAAGAAGAASEALRRAVAAAGRALRRRPDLEGPLVTVAEACAEAGDGEALEAATNVAERLEPEARALLLFAAARGWLKLGQGERARSTLDRAIHLALAAEARITLTEAGNIGWRAKETMAALAAADPAAVAAWVNELFADAMLQGREVVLRLIATLAPVLQRLGAVGDLWAHWQRVDALLVRSRAA